MCRCGSSMSELVSIVTPAYNAERYIAGAIESVIAQHYDRWELIVVDDRSSDDTAALVQASARGDKRIRPVQSEYNLGPGGARNLGIRLAQGRYIAFLDSDDLWDPHKLEVQISAMQRANGVFCFSSYRIVRPNSRGQAVFNVPGSTTYRRMLRGSVIGCSTAVYDTAYFGKCYFTQTPNGVRDGIVKGGIHEDYAMWLSMLKRVSDSSRVVGIDVPLATYRIQKQSFSSNKVRAARSQWSIYRQLEQLNLVRSIYYFAHYGIGGLLRYRQIAMCLSRDNPPHIEASVSERSARLKAPHLESEI